MENAEVAAAEAAETAASPALHMTAASDTRSKTISKLPTFTWEHPGVSEGSLMRFLFPAWLDNPDSTGRLELYAQVGPADEDGRLRGGPSGAHKHSDLEIGQMIAHNCREALYDAFAPKPRSAVEAAVGMLFKVAMLQRYTEDDVRKMILQGLRPNEHGLLNFTDIQDAILKSQKERLRDLIKKLEGGKPVAPPKERPPRVPFQSRSASILMSVTHKKKVNAQEEELRDTKRLHSYSGLVAPLEQQNCQGSELRNNVALVRHPGGINDRWDRYCALRRTGRGSYVEAKNWNFHMDHPRLDERFNPALDDGLANKYPGVCSILSASASGSSAAVQLAT